MTLHHGISNHDIYRAVQRALDGTDLNDGSNDCHVGLYVPYVQSSVVRMVCRDHGTTLGTCNLRTHVVHWYYGRCPLHPDEVAS